MELFLLTLVALQVASVAGAVFMLRRNNRVYQYRKEVLQRISDQSHIDILNKRDWEWRYDVYQSVDYSTMMWRFWKPLDSFYQDMSFLEPTGAGEKADHA